MYVIKYRHPEVGQRYITSCTLDGSPFDVNILLDWLGMDERTLLIGYPRNVDLKTKKVIPHHPFTYMKHGIRYQVVQEGE